MQGQQGQRGWGVDWDGGDVPSLILASIISGFLSAYTCTTTRMPPIIFFAIPTVGMKPQSSMAQAGSTKLQNLFSTIFQGGHFEPNGSLFNIISDHQLRLIIRHQAFGRAVLGFYFHLACRCAIVGLFITQNDMTFEIPCNFLSIWGKYEFGS